MFKRYLRHFQTIPVLVIAIVVLGLVFSLRQSYSEKSKSATSPVKKTVATPSSIAISPNPTIQTQTLKILPSNTPTPIATSQQFITIISPQRGSSYKYGESIPIELKVQDANRISKIDLAWGKNGQLGTSKTLTNPPYTHSFRITEYSPYFIDGNKLTIGAYVYDKEGKYFAADLTEIFMSSADYSVSFKKPTNEQNISGTNTLDIEAEVSGNKEIDRVEIYAGSGALIKTFTEKPYTTTYDISHITCCFDSKYNLPLTVRAYAKDGGNVSQSILVRISK